MSDRLLSAEQVSEILGISIKTIRRWNGDTGPDRQFPRPVQLPSPSGSRPMSRWRESEVRQFGGLQFE